MAHRKLLPSFVRREMCKICKIPRCVHSPLVSVNCLENWCTDNQWFNLYNVYFHSQGPPMAITVIFTQFRLNSLYIYDFLVCSLKLFPEISVCSDRLVDNTNQPKILLLGLKRLIDLLSLLDLAIHIESRHLSPCEVFYKYIRWMTSLPRYMIPELTLSHPTTNLSSLNLWTALNLGDLKSRYLRANFETYVAYLKTRNFCNSVCLQVYKVFFLISRGWRITSEKSTGLRSHYWRCI